MSWLFGYYSKTNSIPDDLSRHHPEGLSTLVNQRCYTAAGGNGHNTYFSNSDATNKFVLCGIPIDRNTHKILEHEDVEAAVTKENFQYELDGHFCGLILKDERLTLFTDPLGLRELHIYETGDGWYFSTRLDWLLKLDSFEIDFSHFGSRWMLINQISNDSIIKNILRLNCGAKALFSGAELNITSHNWIPQATGNFSEKEFSRHLRDITLIGRNNEKKISLSLSGGMDSRVILSQLLTSDYDGWDCHTFQTHEIMDLEIARTITDDFSITHHVYEAQDDDTNNLLPDLFEYVGNTYLTGSSFTSRKLSNYGKLSPDEIIIDGGFGEIWRREFLNRLYLLGKNDLLSRNYSKISTYLVNPKAEIFNEDIYTLMQKGINDQFESMFTLLPDMTATGIENWLDLFSLKTRLTNFYAQEQARIDSYVTAYMPFVQKSLLENLLIVPVEIRKNNRLFKTIIANEKRELKKYPLAKGNMKYPFYYSSIMKRVHSKLFDKFGSQEDHREFDTFLNHAKDFTFDSLHSQSAKEYAPYNYKMIVENVESYYKGESAMRGYVDWFLTFEIFRQIIQ